MSVPVGYGITSQTLESDLATLISYSSLICIQYLPFIIAPTKTQVCKNNDGIERNIA